MALTSGFYPSKNGDRKYSAEQFGSLFDGILRDGILQYYGDKFIVKPATTGFGVLVGSGRAWYNHIWVLNTSDYYLGLSGAETLQYRRDAVVLRIAKDTARAASLYIAKGTATGNSNPMAPSVSSTDDDFRVVIATILVRPKVTSISAADIANFAAGMTTPAGTNVAVYSSGLLQTVDFNQLFVQWSATFNQSLGQLYGDWNTLLGKLHSDWNTLLGTLYNNHDGVLKGLYTTHDNKLNTLYASHNSQLNTLYTTHDNKLTTLYNSHNTSLTNLYNTHNTKLTNLYNDFYNRFEAFMFDSNQTFEAFMARIDAAFDAFEAQKQEEIDEMLANLGNEFSVFWESFKALMNEYLTGQEGIWERWFSHIQGQLDEDAAGHLQNQIDALTYIYVYDRELIFPGNAASVGDHELILSNPAITTPIPAFGVDPDTGHLNYASNQTFNVDDTSGHIQWDFT